MTLPSAPARTPEARQRLLRRSLVVGRTFALGACALLGVGQFLDLHLRSPLGIGLVLALALGAELYVRRTRPDLLERRPAGVPALAVGLQEYRRHSRVRTLDHPSQLEGLHALAVEAFAQDAMPLELIQRLHWHSRETVYLLEHEEQGLVGYLALFFPKRETERRLREGSMDTLEFEPEHLHRGGHVWRAPVLYVDSLVVRGPGRSRRFLRLLNGALTRLEQGYREHRTGGGPVQVLSLAASEDGRALLTRSLGLRRVCPAEGRADEMDLYAGSFDLADLLDLRERIRDMLDEGGDGLPAEALPSEAPGSLPAPRPPA